MKKIIAIMLAFYLFKYSELKYNIPAVTRESYCTAVTC